MDVEFLAGSKGFKNRKIKFRHLGEIEPHEALLDGLAQKKEEEMGQTGKKFEVPLSRRSLGLFCMFSLALIVFLFAKTFQLQVIQGKDYLAQAQENKFIVSQIQSERGVIYDKNMNQLVYNEPSFDLILDKASFPQDEAQKTKVLKEVSQIINEDFEILKDKSETEKSIPVLENIPQDILVVLETRIKNLPGFKINQNWVREYKGGEYFSQVIGYMGKITAQEMGDNPDYSVSDWLGKAGLEKTYEQVLKKNSGKLQVERDALGREVSRQVVKDPSSGESLVLWLDSDLQKKITDLLNEILKRVGAKKAAAIALDPRTGGVLALVSLPTFDNNLFNKGSDQESLQNLLSDPSGSEPLFNRAISGRYLTGSAIKPLIASAVLQEKIISPDKKIYDAGFISVPNQYNPEIVYKYTGIKPHGWVDIRAALAVSSNIYFYTVGGGYGDQAGLGPTAIKKYLNLFGWGQKTGIDLPGEASGFVPDKEWKKKTFPNDPVWGDGDTYNLSIGQGYLQITPLELANSFAAIANGGTLFKPEVVHKIINNSSGRLETVKEIFPEIISSNFIGADNLQIVREGMRLGVTGVNTPDALATLLNTLPVKAAAKTGTAQLGNDYNNNWISVFAPYDDPQIVLTIVVQDVKGLQTVTVPLARDILQWYFSK